MDTIIYIKAAISAFIGYLSLKLGLLAPLIMFLTISMALDYLSGIISAAHNGELSSRIGIFGIFKKLGYCIAVSVALIADKLIATVGSEFVKMPMATIFGTLTVVWLTLNELLSILENLGKIGVPLPAFLGKIIKTLKNDIDKKGEDITTKTNYKVGD